MTFREDVFSMVKAIPRGSTMTYKEVAGAAGRPRAYRTVGNILNTNSDPAIPCHRVVRSDGHTGGYNRGKVEKLRRLKEESPVVLDPSFFSRPTLIVCRELLGKHLVTPNAAHIITEVEAYDGLRDKASHASSGRTLRNAPMFGPPGHWYVYLVYGMHSMLNIVTREEGYPAAILIRSTREVEGPGRLTRTLDIDRRLNGLKAEPDSGLWIEDRGLLVPPKEIIRAPRVGVDYAGEWAKKPWRFVWGM